MSAGSGPNPEPKPRPPQQLPLNLRAASVAGVYQVKQTWQMTPASLREWADRIHRFQAEVRQQPRVQQTSLFDLPSAAPSFLDSHTLDPFATHPQSLDFWRWQPEEQGDPALYFVIDWHWPILLYVGETAHQNQRWKGTHACKDYIRRYVNTHHSLGLTTQVSIGFEGAAPSQRKKRQALEQALIQRWKSPFNKENWSYWQTPFVG